MKLIVGLGNIGDKFKDTRHNLGFRVVDVLAQTWQLQSLAESSKFQASIGETAVAAEKLLLAKPTTYMNLSGQSVLKLVNFYKLRPEDVWVIYDEADLEFGRLRIRLGGSSAGHNGVKSVAEAIGENFWRFRIGIKSARLGVTPTDQFVLDKFSKEERGLLPTIIERTAAHVVKHLSGTDPIDTTYDLLER